MSHRLLLIFLALSCFSQGYGQNNLVDSLRGRQRATTDLSEKIQIDLRLTELLTDSRPKQGLEYAVEAVQLATRLRNDSLLTRAHLLQGAIYLHVGNYPLTLEAYQKAIASGTKVGDPYMLAAAYGNIGTMYYQQNNHQQALKYFSEALTYFDKVDSSDLTTRGKKANLLSNMGIIHEEAREYDEAVQLYRRAFELAEINNDLRMMANVLNNQGTLFADRNQFNSALAYYHRALSIRRMSGNKPGLARSYHNLGFFYSQRNVNNDSALFYLKKATDLGQEIGLWETVQSATQIQYQIYREGNRYEDALRALELNRQVKDSLFNETSTRRITQLEMQFEFDRQQDQWRAAQRERELYWWMSGGGLALLLIIVSLLFFLQRSKTKRSELEQAKLKLEKQSLENNLAIRDRELATNIMYLINKNELINSVSEKLLNIKEQVPAESQATLQKLVLDIQSNLQPELWKEFDFRFQQVHEQFYRILTERFPDLTPSERRLCAFLKLNMTTKEISAITHQNAKSIDVARTRLRKKLNLTGTDHNLVTFLVQLGNES